MMSSIERQLRNISDYLVADYEYKDTRENYEYLLNDLASHNQKNDDELYEMYEVLIELYERRKAALERLK